jgi:hypothetical protein
MSEDAYLSRIGPSEQTLAEWRESLRGDTEQLHQRGHHVQHAHGRRAQFDASTDAHSGAMIALMPTAADAKRLALKGGEAAAELHCTLWFLGGDAAVWDEHMRSELTANLTAMAHAGLFGGPVQSRIFGIAHWNAGSKAPSWVWSVGDDPDADPIDRPDSLISSQLDNAHQLVCDALESMHEQPDDAPPAQHSPWIAHICAAYTDDLTLARELEKRNGPVTFDRIRVSFGDQNTDIPLSGTVTAAAAHRGEFRRALTPVEVASRIDFAGHQRGWKADVDALMRDWSGIQADWRTAIRTQLAVGGTADSVDGLRVDTAAAADLLYRRMEAAAMAAGRAQQRAAEQQGVTVPSWDLDGPLTASALSRAAKMRLVARTTATTQASRLIDSAKRKATALSGVFSGIRLASEVDQSLSALSDAFAREGLGAALSEAQAAGQRAVLDAAPSAMYTATEVIDDRVCEPCRQIDGKTFSSLDDADTAYPGGGYVDCLGGGNCRGMLVATWDQGMTAAAEETAMATATELGGKPNQGTKRDKRLRRNAMTGEAPCGTCPDDSEHFESPDVAELAWDGAASRFTDPQYREAAAACDPGTGSVKERCFLPHHDPGGALNRDGLAAAAGRVGALKGHDPAAVAKAKAHLRSHYSSIGEPVPDSLKAAMDPAMPAPAQPKCPPGWSQDPDHDGCLPPDYTPGDTVACPDGWCPDDDGDGCVPVMPTTAAAAAKCPPFLELDPKTGKCVKPGTASAAAAPGTEIPAGAQTAPWNGVLAVEGITTGDGREFAPDALTWRDLPVPLRWNKEDSHGGEPHTVAVNVGRIDTIERVGNQLRGTGVFNLAEPDGQRAYELVKGNFLRGVSIDADSITAADIEYVWPEDPNGGDDSGEPDMFDLLFSQPEKQIYNAGRISAATLCDIPAFAEAYIALTDADGAVTAGGAMDLQEWTQAQGEQAAARAVVAHAAAFMPAADWFENPQLSLPTPVTVDASGRIYGHAALFGTCHIGMSGTCVQPPRESYHDYYLTGTVLCDNGAVVQGVGQITVGTGHASLHADHRAAAEHYDDSHGIWVAGCIRADADPAKVAALRASGQVSGDWRPIGGKLRLVALLAVNVPGFPVPRMRARVAGGQQVMALVAAGQPTVAPHGAAVPAATLSEKELDQMAMQRVMRMLARRVTGD